MAKLRTYYHDHTPINTKNRIIEAAVELFSKEGYNGVSIRDITKEVGIKESSLYHHFPSKDSLIKNIYEMFQDVFESESPVKKSERLTKPIDSYLILQEHLNTFKQLFDRPLLRKIFRILSMERFRDKRAFEIMNHGIYQSLAKSYEGLFRRMGASGIMKPLLNPCLLAQEYAYTILGMFGDLNILKHYNLSAAEIEYSMYEYVKFFWERVKA